MASLASTHASTHAPTHSSDDLSTLAWVAGELQRSLDAAHKSLRRYLKEAQAIGVSDVDSADTAILRAARVQLHQGVGALELVGLSIPARVLRSSETAIQRLAGKPELMDLAAVEAIEAASFAVLDYLQRSLARRPISSVALFPQYRAVAQLAGGDRIHPADLWGQNWRWQELPGEPGVNARSADDHARGGMESLVLALMRRPDGAAMQRMSDFCAELGAGARTTLAATVWRLAAAFFDAQGSGLLDSDVYAKRMASRLLAQLRASVRSDDDVSERLASDLLFFCARAKTPSALAAPRLQAVRSAWQLGDTATGTDYETPRLGRFDPAVINQARKRVIGARDVWSAVAGGDIRRLGGLAEPVALLGDSLTRLLPSGEVLAHALQAATAQVAASGEAPSTALAMEMATAVLWLDAVIEEGEFDAPGLAQRTQLVAQRVELARTGGQIQPLQPWIEELYRRVSDRQTMGSVVHELRVSLTEIEKQIDQYFRDPRQRELLLPVPAQLGVMRGVLSVLDLEQGSMAVAHMRHAVDELASTEVDLERVAQTGNFERLADNLGALGFLIDMLSVQPVLARSLFRFDVAEGRLVSAPGPTSLGLRPFDDNAGEPGEASALVQEAQVLAHAAGLPHLSDEDLTRQLEQLSQRAVADDESELARVASQAQQALANAVDHEAKAAVRADLAQAVSELTISVPIPEVPPSAPVPEVRADAKPVAPGQTGLEDDAEMRGIFIEEAREVIAQARQALQNLTANAEGLGDITLVRRAFHTLKGSSRMVGLRDFGDTAWACEQVYNARLAEDPRVDPTLHSFTADALSELETWVDAIDSGATAAHDASALMQRAQLLRGGAVEFTPAPAVVAPDVTISVTPAPAPEFDVAGDAALHADDALPELMALYAQAGVGTGSVQTVAVSTDDEPSDRHLDEHHDVHRDEHVDFHVDAPAPSAPSWVNSLAARVSDLPSAHDLDLAAPPPLAPHAPETAPDFSLDLSEFETAGELSTTHETLPVTEYAPPEVGEALEFDLEQLPELVDTSEPDDMARLLPVLDEALDELPFDEPLPDATTLLLIDLDAAAVAADSSEPMPTPEIASEFTFEPVPEPAPATPPLTLVRSDAVPHDAVVDFDEEEEPVKLIGGLRIAIPLFNIFLNEADEQSRRLVTELAEWGLEHKLRALPEGAVALAHSLAGNSATVGYSELSTLARALEHSLMRSAAGGLGRAGEPELFNDSAEEIRRMLHQFAAGFLPPAPAELMARLTDHEHWPLAVESAAPEAEFEAEPEALPEPELQPEVQPEPEPMFPTAFAVAPVTTVAPMAAADDALRQAQRLSANNSFEVDPDDEVHAVDALDALDFELLPIFEEEADELLPQLQSRLRDWAANPADRSAADACMRTLHTFKGGARLAGAMRVGELAHRLETAIEALLLREALARSDIEPLLGRLDRIVSGFESTRKTTAPPVEEAAAVETTPPDLAPEPAPALEANAQSEPAPQPVAQVLPEPPQAEAAHAEPAPEASATVAALVPPAAPIRIDWSRFNTDPAFAPAAPLSSASSGIVRVRTGLLDRLVNGAGEVSIARARIESDVRNLQSSLEELTTTLERMRRELRDIELQAESQISSRIEAAKASAQAFDPLEMDRFTRLQELTRMMAESVNDVATVQRGLTRTLQSTEDQLAAQSRLTRDIQDDLLRTRMVEFESLAERLYRVVRQAAKDTGKQVRLEIVGGSIEVDRGVLERMVAPFEHLLRNSVAHGIELPEVRAAAGKERTGAIAVKITQAGNEVSVEIGDDGAGLDLPRIRTRAVERELLAPDAAPSDAQLAQLIFVPGFSTASVVTELSGRGIGMDVVRAEVDAMGGRIEIDNRAALGASFRLVLPLTTAVTQVVMLRCGRSTIAVPSTLIELVRRVPNAEVARAHVEGQFDVGGEPVPFFWLAELLQGSGHGELTGRSQAVVIIRSAAQRVALHVDEVLGNQEVVVKNLGPQLARMPALAGVTLLPSGAVALIYNPVALVALYGQDVRRRQAERAAASAAVADLPEGGPSASAARVRAPLVMVVDDSLTVRRVTQRLLEREGYRVVLARDGVDALERLADETPAVMLCDIEMPRMDGFELVRTLRANRQRAAIPVVMITSRIAQKHRDHAAQLGVEHYLGKPYPEDKLLALVAHYARSEAMG